jgi:hypothetical protein
VRAIRILASSLVALAGALLIAIPARACDDRYPTTCAPVPAVQAEDSQASAQPARTRKSAASTSQRKRALGRAAGRKSPARAAASRHDRRGAQKSDATEAVPLPPTPPDRAEAKASGHATVGNAVARDSAPKAPPRNADSPAEGAGTELPGDAFALAHALPNADADTTDRAGEPIVIVSHAERNEIDLAALAPPQPADQNWLARLLAALGGAFAAASVLRFLAA